MWQKFNSLKTRQIIGIVLGLLFIFSIISYYGEWWLTTRFGPWDTINIYRFILLTLSCLSGAVVIYSMIVNNRRILPNVLQLCMFVCICIFAYIYTHQERQEIYTFSNLASIGGVFIWVIMTFINVVDLGVLLDSN